VNQENRIMPNVLQVYDPAMCCSTGVCGPSVDAQLVRFAADLDWLAGQGVQVERFNLAQQPAAFVASEAVKQALTERGEAALPVVMAGSTVVSIGTYPSRAQLADWAGVPVGASPAKRKLPLGVAAPSSGCCGSTPDEPCC
jgi:arsenite methyltransferase